MTVYYMRRKIDGAIKIGYTGRDPERRLREIANTSGLEIELLATEPGTVSDEQRAHADFAALRMAGEWFRPGPELLEYIDYARWCASPEGQASARRIRQIEAVAELLRERVPLAHLEPGEVGAFDDDWAVTLGRLIVERIGGTA